MPLKVFYSSVSCSAEMRDRPQKIFNILDAKKIKYEVVDISQNTQHKDLMRQLAGDPKALPPQICNGDTYCGDYTAFDEAIEAGNLEKFLKI
ncbi:SH3 domain-binding glutamic acid-rich-like protein 3 [Centropristis striata]|uniref:SH3 domain-binding glutamic acid-rich-like protein 3 n=1 Tax=Centropristis striata TaxID=184440 RepID=UPI0027DF84A9|nr:SH3 domain-binding glutamic acid-rich-like protein 3 [Centropristis striata]